MNKNIVRNIISAVLALVIAAAAFTAGFFTRKCTQGSQLSSLEWALDVIEKNYYFGGSDGLTDISLSAIANEYLDIYSEYYTAEEYAQAIASNSGSKSGIGISYSFVADKGILLNTVQGNSPAYKCGLRAGEYLVSGSKAGGGQITFSSSADFLTLLDGAADGEPVSLTAADGKVYEVAKAAYTASYTTLYTNSSQWYFSDAETGGLSPYERQTDEMGYLPDGFGYISISQFYGTAAREFGVLVEKFNAAGCTSLIIDLRSDGGGYVDLMRQIAGSFTEGQKKPAMYSIDKKGNKEVFYCIPAAERQRVPAGTEIYVLANSGTASASEALIGALICYDVLKYENIYLSDYSAEYLNWLSGFGQEAKTSRTYGKGIMQSTFVNGKTGEALKLTTAQIYWPDGETCIHDRGITAADGCKTVAADWVITKGDPELKSA
ncbi:MAG: hypothetical protein K2H30_02330, partial [Clostridia bacterium]|nr:hypothetical protein [Clostridia bacterium]